MCLCQEQSESSPKDSLSSWERQISAPEWGWPQLSPISPSHGEHWRVQHAVHQHKQVTSSDNSTLYSISIKAVDILICHRLFADEQSGWIEWGPGVLSQDSGSSLKFTICNLSFSWLALNKYPASYIKHVKKLRRDYWILGFLHSYVKKEKRKKNVAYI